MDTIEAKSFYKKHYHVITSKRGVRLVMCVTIDAHGSEINYEVYSKDFNASFTSPIFEEAVLVFNREIAYLTRTKN